MHNICPLSSRPLPARRWLSPLARLLGSRDSNVVLVICLSRCCFRTRKVGRASATRNSVTRPSMPRVAQSFSPRSWTALSVQACIVHRLIVPATGRVATRESTEERCVRPWPSMSRTRLLPSGNAETCSWARSGPTPRRGGAVTGLLSRPVRAGPRPSRRSGHVLLFFAM